MANIHPTAIVDPEAKLAGDVEVGAYCIVEKDVEIGPGTVLRSHVVIRRYTTLGAENRVDPFAVLGGDFGVRLSYRAHGADQAVASL